MAKKKKEKKEDAKKEKSSFDYKEYIEKTFTNPKAFIYYIVVNDLTLKNKDEVNDLYNKFKVLGGN